MATTALTSDSQAITLLCSSLALPPRGELKPLTQREWNDTATQIARSSLGRPAALIGKSEDQLVTELGIPGDLARQVVALLTRGGQLAFELERLAARGLWLLTRADEDYPRLWKRRLGPKAPPVVFGAGSQTLLESRAVAIAGSRNVDPAGLEFAQMLGRRCAQGGLAVASGAARGVDLAAMGGALEAGGSAVGVLADSLERATRRREVRDAITDGSLTLVSPFHPAAGFSVGRAMRRNSLIYCLAEAAVVVASGVEEGGTRAGAHENLRASWVPLYVRDDGSAGNSDLIRRGGLPLPENALDPDAPLWLSAGAGVPSTPPTLLERDPAIAAPAEKRTTGDASTTLSASTGSAVEEPDVADSGDLFSLVWPRLAGCLRDGQSERDVAARLQLRLYQARAWLKRAVGDGLAKLSSGGRYVLADGCSMANKPDGAEDVFSLVWPRLATYLVEKRTERSVAKHFGLELAQARAWLERAVDDDLATRPSRERLYVVASRQSSLFPDVRRS